MPRTIQIQDLPTEEIAALLAKNGSTLTRDQIVALQEFIDGILSRGASKPATHGRFKTSQCWLGVNRTRFDYSR